MYDWLSWINVWENVCTTNGDEINNNARESASLFRVHVDVRCYLQQQQNKKTSRKLQCGGTNQQRICRNARHTHTANHSVGFLFIFFTSTFLYKPIFHIWLYKWYSISFFFSRGLLLFGLLFFALTWIVALINESENWSILLYDDQISLFSLSFLSYECYGATMNSHNNHAK